MSVRERDPLPAPRNIEVPVPPVTAGDVPGLLGSAFILGTVAGCWNEYRVYVNPQATGNLSSRNKIFNFFEPYGYCKQYKK